MDDLIPGDHKRRRPVPQQLQLDPEFTTIVRDVRIRLRESSDARSQQDASTVAIDEELRYIVR